MSLLALSLLSLWLFPHDPTGVVVDPNGNVYVTDPYRCRIFEVTPDLRVSRYAGTVGHGESADGPRLEARLGDPHGIACDSEGNLFVADYASHRIRRIDREGRVTTLAGDGDPALFDGPQGIAVDSKGNVLVADTGNHRIRRIDPGGRVATLAGPASDVAGDGAAGFRDGSAAEARFRAPMGIALGHDGALYVADYGNDAVRRVAPDGSTTTVGGLDAGERRPRLADPWAVAVAPDGAILVAESGADRIVRLAPDGTVRPLEIRETSSVPRVGPAPPRRRGVLDRPCGLALDRAGNLYVLDAFSGPDLVLSRLSPEGDLTVLVNFGGQSTTAPK